MLRATFGIRASKAENGFDHASHQDAFSSTSHDCTSATNTGDTIDDWCCHYEPTTKEILRNDNVFIVSGFREDTEYSFWRCLGTLFTLHNDTLNIWTHLIAAIYQLYALFTMLNSSPVASAAFSTRLAITIYLLCCFLCFSLSAAYHLFRSFSVKAFVYLLMGDIIGVTLEIFGSNFLYIVTELNCFTGLRTMYLIYMISLGAVIVLMVPRVIVLRKTKFRTLLLSIFSCTGLICWLHHYFLTGFIINVYNSTMLINLLETYAWIVGGLTIRAMKVPECLSPGTFDVWLASHQIFHVFVAIGSVQLLRGPMFLYDNGIANTCGQNEYFY